MKQVTVIGSGACGLTTAYRLKQAGFDVTVLEQNNYSGGRTLTIEDKGFIIDQGASLMPSSYKEHLALAREVGLGDEVVPVPSTSGTYIDGQFYYMEMDKPIRDLISAPYLSLSSKLGFARLMPSLMKYWSKLGFNDLSEAAGSDVETARDYCRRLLTDEAYDRVINPLLRGMYIANGDEVSATQLLWIIRNFSGVSVFGFKNGMQSLANRLAEFITVDYGVEVERVDNTGSGVRITARRGGECVEFDTGLCVITTDGKDLQQIYGQHLTERQNLFLTDLYYSPIKMISFMTSKRPKKEAVLMMPTEQDDPDLALIVMDHLYADSRCPEGCGMISFLAMNRLQEQWVDDTDNLELIQFGNNWLKKYFPELTDSVLHTDTRYWPRATTVGLPGNYRKLKGFVDDIDPKSNVYFTGDYMVASSVGVAVSTGNALAEKIINQHKNRQVVENV